MVEVGDCALLWDDDRLVDRLDRVEAMMAEAVDRLGDVVWTVPPRVEFRNPTPVVPLLRVCWYGVYEPRTDGA